MIAATRAIVASPLRRGNSVSQKPVEREVFARSVVEAAPGSRPERPPYPALSPVTLPLASFVAQLIATHQALPQTRIRNRAEAADAALAYRRTSRSVG